MYKKSKPGDNFPEQAQALGDAIKRLPENPDKIRTYKSNTSKSGEVTWQPSVDVKESNYPSEWLTQEIRTRNGVGRYKCQMVLVHIADRSRQSGYCYESKKAMANKLFPNHTHPQRELNKCLTALQEAQLILMFGFKPGKCEGKIYLPWHPNSQRLLVPNSADTIPPHTADLSPLNTADLIPPHTADKLEISPDKPGARAAGSYSDKMAASLESAKGFLKGHCEANGISYKKAQEAEAHRILDQATAEGKDPLKVCGKLEIVGVKTFGLILTKLSESVTKTMAIVETPLCDHPHHYDRLDKYHCDQDTGKTTICPEWIQEGQTSLRAV